MYQKLKKYIYRKNLNQSGIVKFLLKVGYALGIKKRVIYTKEYYKDKPYEIGDHSYGIPAVHFENEESNLFIGKYCSIAENVQIFLGGNHRLDWVSTYPFNIVHDKFPKGELVKGHPATKGSVVVGNDVWIGRNSTIMSGVKIGNGAVIAANALVIKDVGPYEIWGGNPAKFLKKRFSDDHINYLEELEWWNWDVERVNSMILGLCDNPDELKKQLEQN